MKRSLSALSYCSLLLAGLHMCSSVVAEDLCRRWSRIPGSSEPDYALGVAPSSAGNVYIAGSTRTNFYGQANPDGYSAFLQKRSQAGGDHQWSRVSPTTRAWCDVVSDDSDNAYVAGYTDTGDAIIAKYTDSGVMEWGFSYGGAGGDWVHSIALASNGDLCIAGETSTNLDGQLHAGATDIFLSRRTSGGLPVWTRLLGSASREGAHAVTVDDSGNIYVAGGTWGHVGGQFNIGGYTAFLAKYTSDGTREWTRMWGSTSWDMARGLTTDTDGNVYVAGTTRGEFDTLPIAGSSAAFLTKFTSSGTKQWTKLLGEDTASATEGIALERGVNGHIVMAGSTSAPFDLKQTTGAADAFVATFDADGNRIYSHMWGSSSSETVRALRADDNGLIYVAGGTASSWDGIITLIGTDAFLTQLDMRAQNLLLNSGAEHGDLRAWDVTTGGNYPVALPSIPIDSYAVAMGDGGPGLGAGNMARIEQTVTIRPEATYATLRLHYLVSGTDAPGYDNMSLWINGFSPTNWSSDSAGWRMFEYDMTPYIGSNVTVGIRAWTFDEQTPVNYLADNVKLLADVTPVRAINDFDTDGRSDIGCYDAAGNLGQTPGSWYMMTSTDGFRTETFGYAGTVPITGDFDGDGTTDYGCYDATGNFGQPAGSWYIMTSTDGFRTETFGYPGTVPIAGDFDGDGITDFGCYDAAGNFGQPSGSWYMMTSTEGFRTETFGYAGTVPIVGDLDGDGRSDYGCYDAAGIPGLASPGSWYFMQSTAGFITTVFGYAGTVPIAGDYDGDGFCDYGCYDAAGIPGLADPGSWYSMRSDAGFQTDTFGYAGTVPVAGDFDGDGTDDLGCYDATGNLGQPAGSWYLDQSTDGFRTETFGYAGTVPIGTSTPTP